MNRSRSISMVVAVLSVFITAAVAQLAAPAGFDISWSTVDGGGGVSVGGTFALTGTIGQPDAGPILSGGGFSVAGGFWPGSVQPEPTCPADVALPHNGMVDIDDLVVVITHWGQAGGLGDVNHDNAINIDDLVQVIVHWGMCL
jgi:hypothetical protein